jgi:hypothetical protein
MVLKSVKGLGSSSSKMTTRVWGKEMEVRLKGIELKWGRDIQFDKWMQSQTSLWGRSS